MSFLSLLFSLTSLLFSLLHCLPFMTIASPRPVLINLSSSFSSHYQAFHTLRALTEHHVAKSYIVFFVLFRFLIPPAIVGSWW
ncbi:hypothetical protein V8C44DRAFT_333633 [Trichoderma aethiopicum]